jgi:hypothetical protein
MKRIIALALIATLTLAQFATRDAPIKAEPPDKKVTAKGFRLDEQILKVLRERLDWPADTVVIEVRRDERTWKVLRDVPVDSFPGHEQTALDKNPLDMTPRDQDATGVSRLSPTEQAGLVRWLHKLQYVLAFTDPSEVLQLPAMPTYRPNHNYHFPLDKVPPLLTEKLAIEKARITFASSYPSLAQWQLTRAGIPPSKAPDGTPDKHFDRFSFRPTAGKVHFTDGKRYHTVEVRLETNWVVVVCDPDKGFRIGDWTRLKDRTWEAVREIDGLPDGPPLDKLMTKKEQDTTGVSRLSPTERAGLEKWLGRLVFSIAFANLTKVPNSIYHFHLDQAPALLTEDLAIEKARITLAKEGNELAQWQLTRADHPPSRAPNGTPDEYFDRFGDPQRGFRNSGRVHFTDGKQSRTVQVSLETNWVVCLMVRL